MLQSMRKSVGSWIIKVLFGLLILSFAVWGIGDVFRGGGQTTVVAEVGEIPITRQTFDQTLAAEINRFRSFFGDDYGRDPETRALAVERVLLQLIDRALFDQAARDAGLWAGDDLVLQQIRSEPAFQGDDGTFDPLLFQSILFQSGLTEAGYAAEIRTEVARNQMVAPIGAAARAPDLLLDEIMRFELQQRSVELLTLPRSSVPEPADPDDATLQDWFEARAGRYETPETRAVTVAILSPKDIASGIAIDPAAIRETYDSQPERFGEPERREFEQAVVGDAETAERLFAAVTDNDLAAALAETGIESAVVPVGPVARNELTPELAEAVFASPTPGLAGPVQTAFGHHVIVVTGITESAIAPFETVEAEIRDELQLRAAFDQLFELSTALDDRLIAGDSLPAAAQTVDAQILEIPAITLDGTSDVETPFAALIGEIAFGSEIDEIPHPVEAGTGDILFVDVTDIAPPATPPLAGIRARVIADWKAEEIDRLLVLSGEALLQRARDGEALATLAETQEAAILDEITGFTRSQSPAPLTPALVAAVFELDATGDVTGGIHAQDYRIARLTAIEDAELQAAEQRGRIRGDLVAGVASDLIEQYRAALTSRYGVSRNERVIENAILDPLSGF